MEAQRLEEEDEIPLAIDCYKEIIHFFREPQDEACKVCT